MHPSVLASCSVREGGSLSHGFCYLQLKASQKDLGTQGGVREVSRTHVLVAPEAGSHRDSPWLRSDMTLQGQRQETWLFQGQR